MSRKRRCLLKGSSILVSPAILSSLSSQNVTADFLGVNGEYIFSFFPYFRNYIFSFFSSYYAKEMAACNLLEKTRKIIEEGFPDCGWIFDNFLYDIRGEWWAQYWYLAGTCSTSLTVGEHTNFYPRIVREFHEDGPKLKFYPIDDSSESSFCIENEKDLERVEKFVKSLKDKAHPDIEKLENFFRDYFGNGIKIYRDKVGGSKLVIEWARNFTPELVSNNERYKASKLVYDILNSEILVYSEDYESGKVPLHFNREELDNICNDILKQNEKFKFNLLQKAKEELERKFNEVKLEYNDRQKSFEGKIKVRGIEVPVGLAVEFEDEYDNRGYVCSFCVYDQYELTSFVSFDEKAEKEISSFVNNFEYFLDKAEALKKSGNLINTDKDKGEDNVWDRKILGSYLHDDCFTLYTEKDVKCTFTNKKGKEKSKTFRKMSYEPGSGQLRLYSYIQEGKPFHTYDFGKKKDREEFDKIVDTLVNNKISSCFHPLPSFCKFKNNYWS